MAHKNLNAIRKSPGERVFQVINYILLTVIAVICLYPLLYVAFASVSDGNLLMQHTGILLKPQGFTLQAYKNVFKNPMIVRGYLNTIFLLAVGVTLNIIMTALGAYVLSRKGLFWNKAITMAIVFTMYFSGGMIPFYLALKDLHMTNTLWGLVFPFLISTYNLIIMRTAFASVPEALVESATLDGAGQIRILFSIMLPLIKATLAVMVLYYGVGIWNSWFWASAILRDRNLYPLQVVLREILLQNDVSSMMTGAAAAAAAVMVAFLSAAGPAPVWADESFETVPGGTADESLSTGSAAGDTEAASDPDAGAERAPAGEDTDAGGGSDPGGEPASSEDTGSDGEADAGGNPAPGADAGSGGSAASGDAFSMDDHSAAGEGPEDGGEFGSGEESGGQGADTQENIDSDETESSASDEAEPPGTPDNAPEVMPLSADEISVATAEEFEAAVTQEGRKIRLDADIALTGTAAPTITAAGLRIIGSGHKLTLPAGQKLILKSDGLNVSDLVIEGTASTGVQIYGNVRAGLENVTIRRNTNGGAGLQVRHLAAGIAVQVGVRLNHNDLLRLAGRKRVILLCPICRHGPVFAFVCQGAAIDAGVNQLHRHRRRVVAIMQIQVVNVQCGFILDLYGDSVTPCWIFRRISRLQVLRRLIRAMS